jgi:hypothetical protein
MFTVIVPTMWKYPPFYEFLSDMLMMPSVGEIFIIDNNPDERPNLPILSHKNIRIETFGRNIYVNPAWNYAVPLSKYDRICLYGDDLIFDLKLFHRMISHISPVRGVFGISPGVVDTIQKPVSTGEIEIQHSPTPYNFRDHLGFGMLMFMHKTNWIPIPDGLDLFWGDNFIYDTQFLMMDQNYIITNLLHHTPYASTTSTLPEVNTKLLDENEIYNQIMPSLLEKIKLENTYRTGFA